ncbi:MAG: hypothetical protein ACNS60_16875 [Candidatus Cyclobacteriaceae bacterium M2_1C_046]
MKRIKLLIIPALLFACSEGNYEVEGVKIDSLYSEISLLKNENDSLRNLLQYPSSFEGWYYPPYDGAELLKAGIDNPEEHIKEALRNQPELIPLEPVLGGNMQFIKIDVLSKKWVIAQYEDGHIMGKALYTYDLEKNGRIQFRLLDSVNSD